MSIACCAFLLQQQLPKASYSTTLNSNIAGAVAQVQLLQELRDARRTVIKTRAEVRFAAKNPGVNLQQQCTD
jgi:hypothetical protein